MGVTYVSHAFAAKLLGDSPKMFHRSILPAFSRRSLGGHSQASPAPAAPCPNAGEIWIIQMKSHINSRKMLNYMTF